MKVKVEEGDLKDPTNRFGLKNLQTHIKYFKDSGVTFLIIAVVFAIWFIGSMNQTMNKAHN